MAEWRPGHGFSARKTGGGTSGGHAADGEGQHGGSRVDELRSVRGEEVLWVGRECGAVGGVQVVGDRNVASAGDHDQVVAARQLVDDGGHPELARA